MIPKQLTLSSRGRLILFGFLYFVQGTILAYVYVFNNLYMRAHGANAAQLSLLNGLLVLPFVLKVFIGLLSDKVNLLNRGHRRPYIVFGQLLMMVSSIIIIFLHPVEQYGLFVMMALFMATGLSFFDTAVDGFAVDVTPSDQQGTIQGVMVVGRSIGFVSMAAIYGRLITDVGWSVVFICIALFCLLPFVVLSRAAEPSERPAQQQFEWAAVRSLGRPAIRALASYAVVYALVVYSTNTLIPLYLNEQLGQTVQQVGNTAALSSLGMVVGGLLATLLVQRFTIWQVGGGIFAALFTVLLLLSIPATRSFTIPMLITWGICLAAADFTYVTLAMMHADPRLGASTFAIFMGISNISIGIGQATVTRLIDTVDYRWQFLALAFLSLLLFPLMGRLKRINQADDAANQAPIQAVA